MGQGSQINHTKAQIMCKGQIALKYFQLNMSLIEKDGLEDSWFRKFQLEVITRVPGNWVAKIRYCGARTHLGPILIWTPDPLVQFLWPREGSIRKGFGSRFLPM